MCVYMSVSCLYACSEWVPCLPPTFWHCVVRVEPRGSSFFSVGKHFYLSHSVGRCPTRAGLLSVMPISAWVRVSAVRYSWFPPGGCGEKAL